MRPLTVLTLLAAALAGCGTNEEQRIRATIAAEARASDGQDWNAACALRTAAGRRELLQASLRPDAKTCAEAWTPATDRGSEPIVTFEFNPSTRRLSDIDVDDDVAHVRYDDGSIQPLRKVDGRWLFDAGSVWRRTRAA